jgi:hypothetical protein
LLRIKLAASVWQEHHVLVFGRRASHSCVNLLSAVSVHVHVCNRRSNIDEARDESVIYPRRLEHNRHGASIDRSFGMSKSDMVYTADDGWWEEEKAGGVEIHVSEHVRSK